MSRWIGKPAARGWDTSRPGQTGPGWPAGTGPGQTIGDQGTRPPLGTPDRSDRTTRRTRRPKN